jgi:hypothetical protein
MSATVHRRLPADRTRVGWWLALLGVEGASLLGYLAVTGADPVAVRYLLYPFVWIDAGVWAVANAEPRAGSRRHHRLAVALAAGYFLLVMAVPGNVGVGHLDGHPHLASLRVAWAPPGWGPVVAYAGLVRLYLVPFEVVGYLSLSYLVYANALRTTRGTLGGALGVVTCVGCTVPVLAPLLGLLGGPASGLVTTAYAYSYDAGTALFVLALGVLYASHRRDRE